MDERDDEHGVATQLIDDASGVRGDFTNLRVIELGHAPSDTRGLGESGGAGEDVAHDCLGVGRRVLGDVVVDRLHIRPRPLRPARRTYQASISRASSSVETVRPASMSLRPCWTFPSV